MKHFWKSFLLIANPIKSQKISCVDLTPKTIQVLNGSVRVWVGVYFFWNCDKFYWPFIHVNFTHKLMKHHKTFARWMYGMIVKDPQNHMWNIWHFYFVQMVLSWSIWKLMHLAWNKSGWLYPYVVCFIHCFRNISSELREEKRVSRW